MNKLPHFLSISLTNLRHGGQRMIVAVLCIAFGTMSLSAMSTLADSVGRASLTESRVVLGGDLQLTWEGEEPLSSSQLDELAALQSAGKIEGLTAIADNYTLAIRTPDSGEVHFMRGQGVDPASYPLLGTMEMREPDNVGIITLLANNGDLLVTRDLADKIGLEVGDTVLLSDLTLGTPVTSVVRGILSDTPNHLGDRVFYTLDTERALTGKDMPITSLFVTAAEPEVLETQLNEMGWRTFSARNLGMDNQESQDLMNLLLKGAGILGLMVGGIGVANTMQVLLARRTREIAVFKTLGYSQGDLLTVFVLEAGILGLIGSAIGAIAAMGISAWLVILFGRVTTSLVTWALNPITLGGSILVGVVTTLIFAMYAIIRTTDIRPAALLRNETISPAAIPWWKTAGMLSVLALPFTLTTTVVLGSLWQGVVILVFALAGLIVLGGLLGGLMWLSTRFLPVSRFYLLHMARNNLRRRGWSLVFAMIALFAGIVTLALAAVVTRGAGEEMEQKSFNLEGFNLLVL
ncbi:MAG TPA: FtsX-like permease family protein, partial [Anaerolineales bacterium]|nr:FtsX-like permease family protein [Anaerolineales bacterium]